MSKSRGLIGKIAALVVILAGAAFILGTAPRGAETASAGLPTRMALPTDQAASQPTHTGVPVVAVQPTALPSTPHPTEIEPTQTLAPQLSTASLVQPAAFQAEQPTVIPAPPVKPVPNQVTIQFAAGTTLDQQKAYVQQLGGTVQQTLAALNTLVVTIPDVTAAEALPQSPLVVQTEPDYYVTAQQSAPNDPYYSQQWALPVVQVPSAWPLLPVNAPTVAVAVIDSGICANHPDLIGRILPGYDFVENDTNPDDLYHHGCEVSGIIAANMNNGIGVAGIAPNARIMPLRVLDAYGTGYYSNMAAAIIYAADHGAQIINLSLGGTVPLTTLENAVNYAVARGVLVVAAAGNSYGGAVMYPAAYPNVVAVGSVDSNLQVSYFSAVGPEIDLLAPGNGIETTTLNGTYTSQMGTSFAAPQVAGIAALEIGRGKTLIVDGGIVHADIPAGAPTLTPTPQEAFDKHGHVVSLSAASAPAPTDSWAVVLVPGSDPDAVAAQLGYENLGQISDLPDTYLFHVQSSGASVQAAQETASALDGNAQVIRFEQLRSRTPYFRTPDDDPLYGQQWHLNNNLGSSSINIIAAWNAGFTGTGAQIAIVDDGLQRLHPDLDTNYNALGSRDLNNIPPDGDPSPSIGHGHGTSAAGVAAADDDTTCGVGAAYTARVAGIRLLGGNFDDSMAATALLYPPGDSTINDIYSNSWGPTDDGLRLDAPAQVLIDALQSGVTNGRNGKGKIYVWAAGNGRAIYYAGTGTYDYLYDNINADGYANSRFVIAVGAVDPNGHYSYYSEPGAAMFVTAPSSAVFNGGIKGITTTDLMGSDGYNGEPTDNNCTNKFGGTSSATPLVSGVIALMLQANPNLTWRDVRYILAETAQQNDPADPDWTTNAAGYHINHNYGFGMVDAGAAVSTAQTWTTVPPEEPAIDSGTITVNQTIPSAVSGGGTTSTATISGNLFVENVEVVFNAVHSWRGDLEVILTSPSGTQSRLMEPRLFDVPPNQPIGDDHNFTNWKFMTVRNWGEHSAGNWTLTVVDRYPDSDNGTFKNWKLILHGTKAPPKPPVPTAPSNGVAITTSLPWNTTAFLWNNISTADHLEFQIDTVNPPLATPITLPGTATNYVTNLPLGTFYWRVRAVDNDPNTVEPDLSTITPRSVTIQTGENQPPARNYFTTPSPVLTWTYLGWATAYQIEISTTSTFTPATRVYISPDGSGAGTPIPPTQFAFMVVDPVDLPAGLSEGTYYWRVRGRKADGTWSVTWSTYDSFIIDLP